MSDPTPAPETTPTEGTPTEGAKPEADELGEAGKKAIAAERQARKAAEKSAAELAERLKAIEDRDKTEAQRQQEQLESAKAELEALTTAKTRAEVAAEKAIPTSLLAGPASNSAEDIAAFADALLAFRGEQKYNPTSPALHRVNKTTSLGSPAERFAASLDGIL